MHNTRKHVLVIAATAVICVTSYLWIDLPVTDFLISSKNSFVIFVFKLITRLGESQWYIAGGLLMWFACKKKDTQRASQALLLFTSVTTSGIIANIIKSIVGRARPRLYIKENIYGFDFFHIDYAWLSFPSGHAATALSAASVLALSFPRYRLPFYVAGIVIALSRIVLAQHYLSDVIAGSLLGLASTIIIYRKYFKQKIDASTR